MRTLTLSNPQKKDFKYNFSNCYFSCVFGKISEDKLYLFLPKNQVFIINDIAFVELKSTSNYFTNFTLGFAAIAAFITGLVFMDFIFYTLGLATFLTVINLLIQSRKYKIQITLRDPKRILIPVKTHQLKKANVFVKKFNQYRMDNLKYNVIR